MAGVDVLDPVYVPIEITVDVNVQAEAPAAQVSQAVRARLTGLLGFATQDFGKPVQAWAKFLRPCILSRASPTFC